MNKFLFLQLIVFSIIIEQPASGKQEKSDSYELFVVSQSAPPRLWVLFNKTVRRDGYELDLTHLNPFYLMGDFDCDDRPDFVVKLRHTKEELNSRLVVLRGSGEVSWLDRNEKLRYPAPYAWYVHRGC